MWALLTPKLGGGFQVTSSRVAVESRVVAPSVFFTVLGDVFLTGTFKCRAFKIFHQTLVSKA